MALRKQGKSDEQMRVAYPSLNLAHIHAAISYFYENRDAIETELAEDEGWEKDRERKKAEYLSRRATK